MSEPNDDDAEYSDAVQPDQLPGEVHDLLLSYQQEDETIAETLERVFVGLVPHANSMPESVDRGADFGEEELVIVHNRTVGGDGYVGQFVYDDVGTLYSSMTEPMTGEEDDLVTDGGTQQTATQHTERRFLYLIVDAPDEEMVGKVESVDSPYATCEKNKLRPVNRRDLDTDETWTEQLVGLGYHDFEDYDDDERFAEVCQQKLADIDDEHIREARLEPEGVAPDA